MCIAPMKTAPSAKRRGVEGERPARIRRGHEQPRERRPGDAAGVETEPEQRIRLLQLRLRHRLRDDPLRGGEEERRRAAVQRRERDEVPQLRVAAQQQHRERALARAGEQARADHHVVARQPVCDHAAEEQEQHLRHLAGGQHDAQIRLRAGDAQDRECEPDRRDRVPEHGDDPPDEEQPELASAERPVPCPFEQAHPTG